MTTRVRALMLAAFVAVFGLGFAGVAAAQTGNGLPLDASEDCVENVMDLPALNVCKDKNGRHILNLPAIGDLREPAPAATPAGGTLPKTGMHVEDFAAIGLAALAGGGVLLRRLRLAVA